MLKMKAPQLFILFCFIFFCVIYSLLFCEKLQYYSTTLHVRHQFTRTRPTPSHMSGPNLQASAFSLSGEKIFFTLFARALHSDVTCFSPNQTDIPLALLYRSYL